MTTATLPTIEQIMTEMHASTKQQNGERRNVTSRYVLAELPDTGHEANRKAVVKVSTYHYGDRKRYSTSLMQVETADSVGAGYGFSVEKFAVFSGVTLTTVAVARHSAKAMAEAHASGLAVLEEALHQGHLKVIEQFQVKEQ